VKHQREIAICKATIQKLDLDLSDLVIATECASGPYAYTPVMALLAGAKKVISIGKTTRYGTFAENAAHIKDICKEAGIKNEIEFIEKAELNPNILDHVNVYTNSGMLRPIKADVIAMLPPYAVIPLMWETWEFRESDLDIKACQDSGIAVIGTNESFPVINMFGYNAFIVLKLLFDLGIEGHNNKIVLIGGGKSGHGAFMGLKNTSIDIIWYTFDGEHGSHKYSDLKNIFNETHIDAIINFEHEYDVNIFNGSCGFNFDDLKNKFPSLSYGHICGNISQDDLSQSGLNYLPKKILPFGYMSYATENIGVRPVIELSAMGLKVGEIAARKRIAHATIEETIKATVDTGIGMDFPNGFLNYKLTEN
jgi:hypothetical protein